MPLVRRPSPASEPPAATPASLTEGTSDQRWAAVRAAAGQPGGVALLAAALPQEGDPRVREAIFTGLARAATAESAAAVVPYLRSEDASMRAAAVDALRAMPEASRPHIPRLLADPDADVRLLSCELVRGLPEGEANRLLSDLLDHESEKNVTAAAVEVLAEIGRPEALPALARSAERFADDSFLAFSIKVAIDRVGTAVNDLSAVSEEEFRKVCEFLYRRTGMLFTEAKRYYVQRRITERMTALRIGAFTTYFVYLRGDADGEIEKFINAFTVNETYFYREEHQLRCLSADLLNERVRAKRQGEALRIWSAPCATGEEPYSIAMWLLENWPEVDVQDIEIVGSDIDTECVTAAREGKFGQRALMRLSPALIGKYFVPAGTEIWRIVDDLRQSVQFTTVNLMDPAETRRHGVFDVIFCRNVLIYFDDASRRLAAENLFECLAPGGFICLGHTESMSRISPLFEVRRFADAIVYQRPQGGAHG